MTEGGRPAGDEIDGGAAAVALSCLLALSAGSTDAMAYLRHHVFAANMTGTTVLLGLAAMHAALRPVLPGLAAIGGFLAGVVGSRWLHRAAGPAPGLLLACFLVTAGGLVAPELASIALLAAGMGAQNAAVTNFAGIRLNTAFITGDLVKFGQALAGESSAAVIVVPLLLAYTGGAALGAVARRHIAFPWAIPAGLLALAAILAWAVARRAQSRRLRNASRLTT